MKKYLLLILCLSFINISVAEDTSKEVKTGNARGFLSDTLDDWKYAELSHRYMLKKNYAKK